MFSCKFSVISVFFLIFAVSSKETVKVTLFYETLCPYSLEFINDQLYPGFKKLGDVVTLDLVPFGNAKITQANGKTTMTCQHGPNECYGNKIHACAIQNNTQDVYMNFIGCDMATNRPQDDAVAEKCAQQYNVTWTDLQTCVKGDEAFKLLTHYGEITKKGNVHYVPHIVFNDVFNRTLEQEARGNFVEAACSLFTEKPSVCTQ